MKTYALLFFLVGGWDTDESVVLWGPVETSHMKNGGGATSCQAENGEGQI